MAGLHGRETGFLPGNLYLGVQCSCTLQSGGKRQVTKAGKCAGASAHCAMALLWQRNGPTQVHAYFPRLVWTLGEGGGSVPASLPSLFPTPPPPCSTYAPRARSKGVTTRECASFLQFTSSMLTHHSEPSLALLRTVSPQVQGSICR